MRDPYRQDIIRQLSEVLVLPPNFWSNTWHFSNINDAMTSLAFHGKALPRGMTPELLRKVNLLATQEFSAFVAPSLKVGARLT